MYHSCHAKDRGATSVLLRRQASADIYGGTESTTPATQIQPEVPVPRLPRKSSLRCRKCHAWHAKDRGATSVLLRRQASADIYGGTESTTPATQIQPEVPKVPRLPRKGPRRHISPTVLLRRQASADIYGGTESTTPATRIQPEVPKVRRLPRKRPWRRISPTSSPSFR